MRVFRIMLWTGSLALACAASADVFDRFPGIRQRAYALPADGAATTYQVADNRSPKLSTMIARNGGILGLSQDALFASDDGGSTWTVLAIDAETYFAGAGGTVYARTSRGLYRTQSNGSSWKAIQLPEESGDLFTGTVDGARVYIAGRAGLFATADDGWAWRKLAGVGEIRQFAVSDRSIAFYRPATSGGFFSTPLTEELRFSGDDGQTWTKIEPPRGGLSSLSVLDDALYAVVGSKVVRWRAGVWTTLTPEEREVQKLAVSDAALYASTANGVLRSVDGGRSWTAVVVPLDAGEQVESIACAGRDVLVTAKSQKSVTLYFSPDAGLQWSRLPASPVPDVLGSSLSGGTVFIRTRTGAYACDVAAKGSWRRLGRQLPPFGYHTCKLAAGRSLGLAVGNTFFRSSDEGQTWNEVSAGKTRLDVLEPAADVLLAAGGNTILTSTDDGRTWSESPAPGHGEIRLLRKSGGTLYVVERSYASNRLRSHVWQRRPEESAWRELAETEDFEITDLVVHDDRLYALTGSALLKMSAPGEWESLSRGSLIDARPYALHVNDRGVLFVASSRGLFWSSDRGSNWRRAAGELFPYDQSISRIIPYSAEGFLLLSMGRLYLCADMTPHASAGLRVAANEPRLEETHDAHGIVLPVTPAGGTVTVTVDGREVPRSSFVKNETSLTLRTDSNAWKAVPDGVTGVEVQLLAPKGNTIREKFFILKEQASARLFEPYKRSLAVLIAVSKYGNAYSNLPSAVAQARELEVILRRQGFEVTPLYDVTRAQIETYLFKELAPRLGPEDRLLVYLAGHGDTETDVLGRKIGYFIPFGAQKSTLAVDGLPMARFEQEYARLLKAKHVLFVIDACFSGLALTREPSRDPETLVEIRRLTQERARAVLAAGRAGDAALDVNGGIFTRAFINGIKGGADRNRNGVITLQELFDEVRRVVAADAARHGYDQLPQFEPLREFGSGEFLFVYK